MKRFLWILFYTVSYFSLYSQQNHVISGNSPVKHISVKTEEDRNTSKANRIPVIHITSPRYSIKNGNKFVGPNTVKILNVEGFTYVKDGSAIEKVLVDNEEAQLNEEDKFEKIIFLSTDTNCVVIESYSNEGNIGRDTLVIVYEKIVPKNYLFIMAIDEYENWPPLQNPVKDAKDIKDILVSKYQFEEANVIELYNSDCTIDSIDKSFRSLIEKVTRNDNVLIFYAGHGSHDDLLKEGYWIPVDAKFQNTSEYLENSIIIKYIAALESRHTLLVADACFSGSLFATQSKRGDNDRRYENLEKRISKWAFTSGRMEQVDDSSPFARYLIKFLKENKSSPFPLSELVEYVTKSVSNNSSQMPCAGPLKDIGDEGGEFIFRIKEK